MEAAATDAAGIGGAKSGSERGGHVDVDGDSSGAPSAPSAGASAGEEGVGGTDASGSGGSGTGLRRRGGRKGPGGQAPAGEAGVAAAEVPHPGPLPDNIYDNGMWAVRFCDGGGGGRCCCLEALVVYEVHSQGHNLRGLLLVLLHVFE